jgi:hypothetical protein
MTTFPAILSDVSYSTASLPSELDGVTARGVLWQIAGDRFLLDVPAVARYLVEGGSSITIDPAPDVTPSKAEHYLMMLPLAALLYQRGMLAFHAAAVSNGEGVVLLSGNSGCGKSTLLAALLQRGWRMLADDLAMVGLNEDGQLIVYPTRSGIALWPDSLNKLGIASESLGYCDANRREFKIPEHFDSTPSRLRGIYRLTVHGKREVECEDLAGGARFQATGAMLYNSHVADALCNRSDYLCSVATLAQTVPYRDLRRPRDLWCVEALSNHIINNFKAFL